MGRPGRLQVATWIVREAGGGYFTQTDAVRGVGSLQGEVRANLEALHRLGLLEKVRNGGPYYRLIQSPVWAVLRALDEAVDSLENGDAEPRLEPSPKPITGAIPATLPRHRSDAIRRS
jgi:hypothetical protein